jgi:hypothetical protein
VTLLLGLALAHDAPSICRLEQVDGQWQPGFGDCDIALVDEALAAVANRQGDELHVVFDPSPRVLEPLTHRERAQRLTYAAPIRPVNALCPLRVFVDERGTVTDVHALFACPSELRQDAIQKGFSFKFGRGNAGASTVALEYRTDQDVWLCRLTTGPNARSLQPCGGVGLTKHARSMPAGQVVDLRSYEHVVSIEEPPQPLDVLSMPRLAPWPDGVSPELGAIVCAVEVEVGASGHVVEATVDRKCLAAFAEPLQQTALHTVFAAAEGGERFDVDVRIEPPDSWDRQTVNCIVGCLSLGLGTALVLSFLVQPRL